MTQQKSHPCRQTRKEQVRGLFDSADITVIGGLPVGEQPKSSLHPRARTRKGKGKDKGSGNDKGKGKSDYKPHNVRVNPKEEELYSRALTLVDAVWPDKLSHVRTEM